MWKYINEEVFAKKEIIIMPFLVRACCAYIYRFQLSKVCIVSINDTIHTLLKPWRIINSSCDFESWHNFFSKFTNQLRFPLVPKKLLGRWFLPRISGEYLLQLNAAPLFSEHAPFARRKGVVSVNKRLVDSFYPQLPSVPYCLPA